MSRKQGNYNQILWHLNTILKPKNRVSLSFSEGTVKLTTVKSWRPRWKAIAYHGCPSCIIAKNFAQMALAWLQKFNSIPEYSLLSFPLKVRSFRPYWAQIWLTHFCYTQTTPLVRKVILHEVLERRLWLFTMETTLTFDRSMGLQVHFAGISRAAVGQFYSFFRRV